MSEIDDLRAEVRKLSDRLEIIDLFYRFAAGMDGQDWTLLGGVWADDAVVDHTATHWGKGVVTEKQHGREEVMDAMKKGVSRHFVSHHVITNPRIALNGDRARAKGSRRPITAGDFNAERESADRIRHLNRSWAGRSKLAGAGQRR